MLKALMRATCVGATALVFAAASPSVVAATTSLHPDGGTAMVPTPSQGGPAPLHIAGNAGTGDASRHTKGGTKGATTGGTKDEPQPGGAGTADTAAADTAQTGDTDTVTTDATTADTAGTTTGGTVTGQTADTTTDDANTTDTTATDTADGDASALDFRREA